MNLFCFPLIKSITNKKLVKLTENKCSLKEGVNMMKKLLTTVIVFTFLTGCGTTTNDDINNEQMPTETPTNDNMNNNDSNPEGNMDENQNDNMNEDQDDNLNRDMIDGNNNDMNNVE